MAPARKKARGGGSVGVGPTDVTPTSVAQVGAFQKDVALCVELMYSLRHGGGPQGKRSFDDMTGGAETSVSSGVPKPRRGWRVRVPPVQRGNLHRHRPTRSVYNLDSRGEREDVARCRFPRFRGPT